MNTTSSICRLLNSSQPLPNGTKELIHQVFVADKNYIVRKPKQPYQQNELEWFISQSRNIEDLKSIAGFIPKIWEDIAEVNGIVNSNYGWCCLSEENGNQFWNAMKHLEKDPNSRRAIMIYNRPSMHEDWIANRGNNNLKWQFKTMDEYREMHGDFMCCQNNHFLIRDNKLEMTVHMRSLDAVFGYNADYIWFDWIFNKAVQYLKKSYPELERGQMVIYADSVHVYARHYDDLEHEAQFGAKNPKVTDIRPKMNNPYLMDPDNNAAVKDAEPSVKDLGSLDACIGFMKERYVIDPESIQIKELKEVFNRERNRFSTVWTDEFLENVVRSLELYNLSELAIVVKKVAELYESVDHPGHYNQYNIEHWDYVEDLGYGYLIGCATKYAFRSDFKGSKTQDLDKIITYCEKFVDTHNFEYHNESRLTIDYVEKIGITNVHTINMLILIDALHCAGTKEYAQEVLKNLKGEINFEKSRQVKGVRGKKESSI